MNETSKTINAEDITDIEQSGGVKKLTLCKYGSYLALSAGLGLGAGLGGNAITNYVEATDKPHNSVDIKIEEIKTPEQHILTVNYGNNSFKETDK